MADDNLMITLETDSERAVEDIEELQRRVKDLNAELEYSLDLLDELKNHESNIKPKDFSLRQLERRFLHGDTDGDDYYADDSSDPDGDEFDGPDVGADDNEHLDLSDE